jgi:hypothetical protein
MKGGTREMIGNKLLKMADVLNVAMADCDKFEGKGVKSAARCARKSMQELKKLANEVRKDILSEKNKMIANAKKAKTKTVKKGKK